MYSSSISSIVPPKSFMLPHKTVLKPASADALALASFFIYISKFAVIPLVRYSSIASLEHHSTSSSVSFASIGNTLL